MPKIKKFNLKLSVYQIQQNLRRSKFPFNDETIAHITQLCAELRGVLDTAAHFETFSDPASSGIGRQLPSGAVALSIAASTIGPGAEAFVARRSTETDDVKYLAAAVVSQASEEARRFAWKIISEDAADEKCELSERTPVTDAASLAAIKDFLGKIEVFPTENGLKPVYSFVESAYWTPVKKKKSGA